MHGRNFTDKNPIVQRVSEKMESKVSIIVPVYNVENTLGRCIESIISQTYQNWEMWLIDDGSRDASGKICDNYSRSDARINTVHKANGGVSVARNTGLDKAKGEYVLFVDSDDYLEQNTLELAMNEADSSGAEVVLFGFYYHFQEEDRVVENKGTRIFVGKNEEFVSEMFEEMFRKELLNPPWNKLIKREMLIRNDIRFISEYSICEDMIFTIGVLDACNKIVFLDVPLYHYIYKKEDNLVNRFHGNYFEALSFYVGRVKEYLSRYKASAEMIAEMGTFYVNQTVAYLKKIYAASGYRKEKKYEELRRICEISAFREEVALYVPKGIKKKVVVSCIKHRWYRILHMLYSEVLCRKQC